MRLIRPVLILIICLQFFGCGPPLEMTVEEVLRNTQNATNMYRTIYVEGNIKNTYGSAFTIESKDTRYVSFTLEDDTDDMHVYYERKILADKMEEGDYVYVTGAIVFIGGRVGGNYFIADKIEFDYE